MVSLLKKYLLKPKPGILIFFITTLVFSFFISNLINQNLIKNLNYFFTFFLSLFIYLILIELIFLIVYFIFKRSFFSLPPKPKFENIVYKGHPYIPYVLKTNSKGAPPTIADYPLHKGKYKFDRSLTNNLGFVNGSDGGRNVSMPKPENITRINCIGSSTTQNYLSFENKVYSYPLELERILNSDAKIKFEVNNCGQGGYNSADIMVRLLLQILDTNPDMIILYQGYADVRSYLSKNFKSDYSHSRYNLSELYSKLKFSTSIPKMPLSFINFLIHRWFPYNLRESLVELIHKEDIDLSADPKEGLKTFERNLQYIIDICIARKVKLVISTYCHFLYKNIKDNSLSKKYDEILDMENEIIKSLSEKNNIYFVDNTNLIPKNEEYFVDSIHFSHKGMTALASNFAKKIKSIYES